MEHEFNWVMFLFIIKYKKHELKLLNNLISSLNLLYYDYHPDSAVLDIHEFFIVSDPDEFPPNVSQHNGVAVLWAIDTRGYGNRGLVNIGNMRTLVGDS